MSNVLSEEEKQQIIALGKLGWSLRRIERLTGVRRETASVYLKAAGVAVRLSGGWGRRSPAKPANGVTTDPDPAKAAIPANPNPETPSCEEKTETAKPANEVTTDSDASPPGSPTNHPEPSASACEPYRELVEHGLSRGRKLRGPQLPEAAGIILTSPGDLPRGPHPAGGNRRSGPRWQTQRAYGTAGHRALADHR